MLQIRTDEGPIKSLILMLGMTFLLGITYAWGSDKIKLTDLRTITLHAGKMTHGRRAAPVPQLECTGGSAGCSAFIPQVVQCYNKGFDGYDVQWKCETDMDNAYRFGKVEVTCEGYDYPNDEYVLKGSCGLRYTIDFTEEGRQRKAGSNSGYGYSNYNYTRGKSGLLSDVVVLIIVVIIIFAIVKTCLHQNQYSTTNNDYPQDDSRYFSGGFRSQAPPPPGFRTDYMPPGGCAGSTGSSASGSGGGGFWTGAMTGGLLGYMFGNRSNQRHDSWGSSRWGDSSYDRPFSGSSNRSDNSSSGTRTASGYGSTSRR